MSIYVYICTCAQAFVVVAEGSAGKGVLHFDSHFKSASGIKWGETCVASTALSALQLLDAILVGDAYTADGPYDVYRLDKIGSCPPLPPPCALPEAPPTPPLSSHASQENLDSEAMPALVAAPAAEASEAMPALVATPAEASKKHSAGDLYTYIYIVLIKHQVHIHLCPSCVCKHRCYLRLHMVAGRAIIHVFR